MNAYDLLKLIAKDLNHEVVTELRADEFGEFGSNYIYYFSFLKQDDQIIYCKSYPKDPAFSRIKFTILSEGSQNIEELLHCLSPTVRGEFYLI